MKGKLEIKLDDDQLAAIAIALLGGTPFDKGGATFGHASTVLKVNDQVLD
jgi:hypothetical protein